MQKEDDITVVTVKLQFCQKLVDDEVAKPFKPRKRFKSTTWIMIARKENLFHFNAGNFLSLELLVRRGSRGRVRNFNQRVPLNTEFM